MSALILAVLDDVSARLSSPRAWLQGYPFGTRDARGAVLFGTGPSNCWCLGEAVSRAVSDVMGHDGYACTDAARTTWTELRSEVERTLLARLERATGRTCHALYLWNDDRGTSFADMQALVVGTWLELLAEAA